ncbi:MAG: putative lipoprotein [Labilithrix sp.]|nr:putative lipoprotein [Labilithrix sp.]
MLGGPAHVAQPAHISALLYATRSGGPALQAMNAGRFVPTQRLLSLVLVPLAMSTAAGCVDAKRSGHARAGAGAKAHVDRSAELARLMSRENGPFPKHRLELFGGLVSGEYEAAAQSKPECTPVDSDGDSSCEVRLGLGKDEDGDPSDIYCMIDTTPRGPFGAIIANRLNGAGLMEMPKLGIAKTGDGVTVGLVANWMKAGEDLTTVGTLKVAVLFNQGYSATCSDVRPGGRKTFDRVVGDFFRTLKFAPNPSRPAFMTMAYDLRKGDRTTGFRYGLIEKRVGGKAGSAEIDFAFRLETDGKTWQTMDHSLLVARDPAGNVELYRHAITGAGGKTVAVLSAKPSEDRKFRLKLERGDKSDALESTPKAPLTTELWSAGEFAKVARGARPSYRYATLGVDDTGEPAFKYLSITRSSNDVLLEEEESDKKTEKGLDGSLKDELHVLGDGSVAKEVSTDSVSQRILAWGKLPDTTGTTSATAAVEPKERSVAKEPRAKGKGKGK